MWPFDTIFADNSDKARLITTVVAAVVAVFVVFATHALSTRKNRAERKATKLEATFSALSRFREIGWTLIHEKRASRKRETDTNASYETIFNELQMLTSIYIPEAKKYIAKMNLIVTLINQDIEASELQERLQEFVELGVEAEREVVSKARKIV